MGTRKRLDVMLEVHCLSCFEMQWMFLLLPQLPWDRSRSGLPALSLDSSKLLTWTLKWTSKDASTSLLSKSAKKKKPQLRTNLRQPRADQNHLKLKLTAIGIQQALEVLQKDDQVDTADYCDPHFSATLEARPVPPSSHGCSPKWTSGCVSWRCSQQSNSGFKPQKAIQPNSPLPQRTYSL